MNSSHFFGNGQEQEPVYTEHDFRHDFAAINKWALSHWRSAYAGCYLDPAHGGRLRVGFTEAQDQRLQDVKELPGLLKPERVTMFRFTPTHPWVELHHLEEAVIERVWETKAYKGLIASLSLEVPRNVLSVEATNVARVRRRVIELFGRAAPIKVTYGTTPVES